MKVTDVSPGPNQFISFIQVIKYNELIAANI